MEKEKALKKIAGMCSRKEYCTREVREKLVRWELSEEDIREVMAFLAHHQFVDDRRFALAYAEDKFRFNHWGKQKIALMLRQKGIAPEILREALESLDDAHYDEGCLELLRQKQKNLSEPDPYQLRAKLTRFALSRGFDYETVNRCLARLGREAEEI